MADGLERSSFGEREKSLEPNVSAPALSFIKHLASSVVQPPGFALSSRLMACGDYKETELTNLRDPTGIIMAFSPSDFNFGSEPATPSNKPRRITGRKLKRWDGEQLPFPCVLGLY